MLPSASVGAEPEADSQGGWTGRWSGVQPALLGLAGGEVSAGAGLQRGRPSAVSRAVASVPEPPDPVIHRRGRG